MVRINSAESNRASIYYLKEASWGVTPGSGTVKQMRLTQSTLTHGKQTKVSTEIRSDRMVSNIIEVGATSSGSIEWEMSAGSQDDFFEAFLLSAWTKSMNFLLVRGSSVSITDTDEITIAGGDYRNWLTVNQYIKVAGFTTLGNNGYFKVAAKAYSGGNTIITTTETSLTAEAGSAYTKVMDANDVLIKANTVTFTSGNTLNTGGSGGEFASVKVGQKIFIESSLGKETGSIVASSTDPTAGDTFTISDGVDSVTFEINSSAALVTAGNVFITLSGTEATMAASIAAAINTQFAKGKLRCSATVSTATVTVTNHRYTGGSITESSGGLTRTDFSGGVATKGGFYTVAEKTDDNTLVLAETLTADANSGPVIVVVKGSHLRNPGVAADITKQSFTIETGFEDVSKFFQMAGERVGEFDIKVQAGDIVTGKFAVQGGETDRSSVTVLNQTGTYSVLGTTATEVLNATSNVGTITKDGVELELAVMSIDMKGSNALREQRAVGEKFPAGIGYGRFMLTGGIDVYFESFEFYDAFRNHETVSLSFNFEDVDNNTYYFTVPALKITTDPITPDGIDKDVMEKMNWQAQRDPALQTQFMMDRFSSVYPFSATA